MKLCRVDHELLGDIRRRFPQLGHYELFWREAIAYCREAVGIALESVKYAGREQYGGGYMRTCFFNECDRRGVRLSDNLNHRRSQKRANPISPGGGVHPRPGTQPKTRQP